MLVSHPGQSSGHYIWMGKTGLDWFLDLITSSSSGLSHPSSQAKVESNFFRWPLNSDPWSRLGLWIFYQCQTKDILPQRGARSKDFWGKAHFWLLWTKRIPFVGHPQRCLYDRKCLIMRSLAISLISSKKRLDSSLFCGPKKAIN